MNFIAAGVISPRLASLEKALHRTAIAIVDERDRDDLHEIVKMNPRHVLLPGADGPAHSEFEGRQHPGQCASSSPQHNAGSQADDTHA